METPVQSLSSADLVESEVGGKAVHLSSCLRAGLPVPSGYALSHAYVQSLLEGDVVKLDALAKAVVDGRAWAARSSAVGEDSSSASFAGQHATVLHVRTRIELVEALRKVWDSAHNASAIAYRAKLGIDGPVRIGVVMQELIAADVAGVLFTKNPMTGATEIVVEGSWGLGESVVSGLVTPDHARLGYDGQILERRVGHKDLMIALNPEGGTVETELDDETASEFCLTDARLNALHALANRCMTLFGASLDLEWAFQGDSLYLLQRRAITKG